MDDDQKDSRSKSVKAIDEAFESVVVKTRKEWRDGKWVLVWENQDEFRAYMRARSALKKGGDE